MKSLRYFVLLLSFFQLSWLQAANNLPLNNNQVSCLEQKETNKKEERDIQVTRSSREIMNSVITRIEKKKEALSSHSVKVIPFGNELTSLLEDGLKISHNALFRILSDTNLFDPFPENVYFGFKKLKKGSNSAQVFKINIEKDGNSTPLVIVKKLCDTNDKKTKESKQQNINVMQKNLGRMLWDIHHYPSLFPQHVQSQQQHLPKVCLVEAYATYNDIKNDSHLLEIIHPAAGNNITDLLCNSFSRKELMEVYEAVGRSLSLTHQAGMTNSINGAPHEWRSKFVHGDFHLGNIFYNNGKVSFIDNETNSYVSPEEGCTIAVDINVFILVPLIYWNFHTDKEVNKQLLMQHAQASEGFLNGYINAYPIAARKKLAQYCYNDQLLIFFKKALNEFISNNMENRFKSGLNSYFFELEFKMLTRLEHITKNSKKTLIEIKKVFEDWLANYLISVKTRSSGDCCLIC